MLAAHVLICSGFSGAFTGSDLGSGKWSSFHWEKRAVAVAGGKSIISFLPRGHKVLRNGWGQTHNDATRFLQCRLQTSSPVNGWDCWERVRADGTRLEVEVEWCRFRHTQSRSLVITESGTPCALTVPFAGGNVVDEHDPKMSNWFN